MKRPKKIIAVIDYGMSNMFSIKNALRTLGLEPVVTSDSAAILSADGAILPGVGSFPEAMRRIKELGLNESINAFIRSGKPFVGICLGFQLLFEESDEIENADGLGILRGQVKSFVKQPNVMRVPHVGWNSIKKSPQVREEVQLAPLRDTVEGEHFYFVHSCYVEPEDRSNIYTTTLYGEFEFCSSVLMDNIFACQFHPEKSGEKGIQILNEMFDQVG